MRGITILLISLCLIWTIGCDTTEPDGKEKEPEVAVTEIEDIEPEIVVEETVTDTVNDTVNDTVVVPFSISGEWTATYTGQPPTGLYNPGEGTLITQELKFVGNTLEVTYTYKDQNGNLRGAIKEVYSYTTGGVDAEGFYELNLTQTAILYKNVAATAFTNVSLTSDLGNVLTKVGDTVLTVIKLENGEVYIGSLEHNLSTRSTQIAPYYFTHR